MIVAVLACAGLGKRLGHPLPKQFLSLAGLPVYLHSLLVFERHPMVDGVVIVANRKFIPLIEEDVGRLSLKKVIAIVEGGQTRQDSVYSGARSSPNEAQILLVHDAARPCLGPELVDRVIEGTMRWKAVVPVIPCRDALIRGLEGKFVEPIDRKDAYLVQTPIGLNKGGLLSALSLAMAEGLVFPDEGTLLHHYGYEVFLVEGEITNIKITFPEDLKLAEIIIKGKM